jgi:hypothetical protein
MATAVLWESNICHLQQSDWNACTKCVLVTAPHQVSYSTVRCNKAVPPFSYFLCPKIMKRVHSCQFISVLRFACLIPKTPKWISIQFGIMCCSFDEFFSVAFSESWLTSETMNPLHYGRIRWAGDRPIARRLPTQNSTTRTYIRASNGIRTHDPSVRAVQGYTRLRPRGNWDRQYEMYITDLLVESDFGFCRFHITSLHEVCSNHTFSLCSVCEETWW